MRSNREQGTGNKEQGEAGVPAISELERRLLMIVQEGVPLAPEPYREIAERLGTSEEQVLATIASLLERRVIKRLAAVPNHYALGVTHNGMSVWNERDEITHCYRRPRQPGWPYNVFAMVHGMSREEVLRKIDAITREAGLEGCEHDVVFSTRILKKQGTRVRERNGQQET